MSGTPKAQEPAETSALRVKWEVPLPWLISGMVVICSQAAIVYFTQVRQGELLVDQAIVQRDVLKQLRELSAMIGTSNIKDVEHDMKIVDHERRLGALEFKVLQTQGQINRQGLGETRR